MALVLSDAEERKRRCICRLAERQAREKNGERKAREKNDERKARETTAERKAREEAWEKESEVPLFYRFALNFDRYEKACAVDPEVGNFDKGLRARTSGVIQGVGSHGFSVDSINFANHALLETEKTFKKIISESSVEISKNPSATELSDLYLGISGKNKELLSKAKDLLINLEESGLADKFLPALECLRIRQSEMLETFIRLRDKLDKKLENVQSWTTLSNVIFGATAAGLLTGSVMAAAFEVPHVAASFAASFTFGSAGTWLYSSLKKYEETIKGQRVLVDSLCENTRGLLKDLDNIRILLGGSSYEVVIDIGEEEGFTDEMGILDSKHTGSCSRDTPYAPDHDQVIPKEVPLVCA